VTEWERLLARRRAIKRRTRWQDRRLDEPTARAVEAVLNGPRPPRPVAALAVETPEGWVVLVQRAEGNGEMERLTTLGQCTPYLRGPMALPVGQWPRRSERWAPLGRLAEEVAPAPGAEEQVREALDDAADGPQVGAGRAATSGTREGA
jgi:hypothetical protein